MRMVMAGAAVGLAVATCGARAQTPPTHFSGTYEALDDPRMKIVVEGAQLSDSESLNIVFKGKRYSAFRDNNSLGPFIFSEGGCVLKFAPYDRVGKQAFDVQRGGVCAGVNAPLAKLKSAFVSAKSAAPAAPERGEWPVIVSTNPVMVSSARKAINDPAFMDMGCNKLLGPGVGVTLRDYRGAKLDRIDDVSRPVSYVISRYDGAGKSFDAAMHYYAPEKAWVLSKDLPPAFMDAMADGAFLTIRNDRGEDVVAFDADGSGALRDAMRRVCGAALAEAASSVPAQPAATPNSPAPSSALKPLSTFRDCDACPEMVVIPSGEYLMGASPADYAFADKYSIESELPRHPVRIGYSFAIGRFEVSVAEFAAFVRDTGAKTGGACDIRIPDRGPDAGKFIGTVKPGGAATPGLVTIADGDFRRPGANVGDRQPATCISRREAKAYLEWLSRKTGKTYRFPTESEWEYAVRAGNPAPFHYGSGLREVCQYGNFADADSPYSAGMAAQCRENPSPVGAAFCGSYRPNAWGLHDMTGNVFEFVADCASKNYVGAPADGAPWWPAGGESACSRFTTRGFFFDSVGGELRSAARCEAVDWDGRSNGLGIRAAVSLDDGAWDRRH